MQKIISLLFVLLIIVFSYILITGNKSIKRNIPQQPWYEIKCLNCGAIFTSTGNKDIEKCTECPFSACHEIGMLIIRIGSLTELVDKQPENKEAKENLEIYKDVFNKHLESCEKCQKAFTEHLLD